MKRPWKIAFESCLWFGLILIVGHLCGGCRANSQSYTFSPLPIDLSEGLQRRAATIYSDTRVYSVGGQVRSPGRQVYVGATTVTKAIQSAGDFTDFAAGNRVQLTRADGKIILVNSVKAARDPSLDPPVYPGDKIVVSQQTFWDSFR